MTTPKVRSATCALIEAVDEGLLDPYHVLMAALTFMSEADVKEFVEMNGWLEEPEEYDGQPDEAQEWYDFDPDC